MRPTPIIIQALRTDFPLNYEQKSLADGVWRGLGILLLRALKRLRRQPALRDVTFPFEEGEKRFRIAFVDDLSARWTTVVICDPATGR
jgi:hypothetical protein